ncbi:MAG: circadian clock KaiB family protein [Actinomycetes bacterium]
MSTGEEQPRWALTLYVSGASANSSAALETIRRICDEQLVGQVELQVVDVSDKPALVIADRVLAVPTLIKRLPPPLRHLVGNLANEGRVLEGLDLAPLKGAGPDEGGQAPP